MTTGTCVPVVTPTGEALDASCVESVSCGCFGGLVEFGCDFYPGYAPAPVLSEVDPALSLEQCTAVGSGGPADAGDAGPTDAGDAGPADAGDGGL